MNRDNIIESFLNIKVKKENTRVAYKKNISDFLSYLDEAGETLESWKYTHVEEYKSKLLEKYAASSVNAKISAVISLYKFMEKNDYVKEGKTSKIRVEQEKIENKVDILETHVITIDTKIDSQSTMLQMLIEGQEESKKRRKGYFDSVMNKIIILIIGGVGSFLGVAIMNYIKVLLK